MIFNQVAGGGSSGGEAVTNGVRFYGFGGEIVEVWDSASVSAKTALPENPYSAGLVAQGWNWTLSSIKSYIANYPNAIVNVGQMYKTASGLTEMYITVSAVTGLSVTCNMAGNKNWGDGTTDNLTSHTYSSIGDYVITCDGTELPAGNINVGGLFSSNTTTPESVSAYWCRKIYIGENVTAVRAYSLGRCNSLLHVSIPTSVTVFENSVFYGSLSLRAITIPTSITEILGSTFVGCNSLTTVSLSDTITSLGTSAFASCFSLYNITIPESTTNISTNSFVNCRSLKKIILPNNLISIGDHAFQKCESLADAEIYGNITTVDYGIFSSCWTLKKIKIPSTVTTVGREAFYNNYCLTECDFSAFVSVPSLVAVNAFNNLNYNCKIKVPISLESAWKTASNWSTYANYIVGV